MQIHFKSYADLNSDINKNFDKISGDWDLVVGIPRSGMIPAYIISLALNINCTDIASLVSNLPLKRGVTRDLKKNITHPWDAKRILLVDDSILSGESLRKEMEPIPVFLKNRVTTLAIYSNKPVRKDIDIVLEFVPLPRVFEWNIFHHKIVEGACVSLEGVISIDKINNKPLMLMKPRYLPSGKIHTIVSCRPASQREEVVSWLTMNGINFSNLVMVSDDVDFDSLDDFSKSKIKSDAFQSSSAFLYIEGNSEQAKMINKESNKPVYCQASSQIYNPGVSLEYKEMKALGKLLIWKLLNLRSRS
ncbi:phosphoribosyltransferase family protein [Halomonas sp. GT]|uniref:phosphoribosyltransferase family protein n=1 Tax=Halomonas sp. GT TaxID=1971364 RepID=UPI0009F481B8|nr:phosphoribosyltransferase [Halomonas sp. GT]